jgi:hypothetical protein
MLQSDRSDRFTGIDRKLVHLIADDTE